MSTNKSISYLSCNKSIIVNIYINYIFYPPTFFFQPNKRIFHPSTFSSLQPNTHKEKLNIFHPPTFPSSHNFLSSHFFTPPTKQTLSASLKTTCDANTSPYVRCTFFTSMCWLNWLNSRNLGLEFLHHQKTLLQSSTYHHGLNLLHHSNSIESYWPIRIEGVVHLA